MKDAELAKIIYEAYPGSDLLPLDPDKDCRSMRALYDAVNVKNFGDGLFKFVVTELYETSLGEDGCGIDIKETKRVLEVALKDIESVRNFITEREKRRYLIFVAWGRLESEIIGPFPSEDARDDKAKEIRQENPDGIMIFRLDFINNKPEVRDYPASFWWAKLEGEEPFIV